MIVVGIDFGHKNCRTAHERRNLRILQNREGEDSTPAVVGLYKGEIIKGRMAVDNAEFAPKDTIISIKRLIGRSYSDPNQMVILYNQFYRNNLNSEKS